jgi:hypothetical protein
MPIASWQITDRHALRLKSLSAMTDTAEPTGSQAFRNRRASVRLMLGPPREGIWAPQRGERFMRENIIKTRSRVRARTA